MLRIEEEECEIEGDDSFRAISDNCASQFHLDRLPNSGLRVEKGREQMFQGSNPKRNVHLVLLARCDIPSSL